MKTLLAVIICAAMIGCSIRPAPGIGPTSPPAEIDERRTYLKAERKSLDNVLLWVSICTLSPVLVGGPTYLIQLPARNQIKEELKSLANIEAAGQ